MNTSVNTDYGDIKLEHKIRKKKKVTRQYFYCCLVKSYMDMTFSVFIF